MPSNSDTPDDSGELFNGNMKLIIGGLIGFIALAVFLRYIIGPTLQPIYYQLFIVNIGTISYLFLTFVVAMIWFAMEKRSPSTRTTTKRLLKYSVYFLFVLSLITIPGEHIYTQEHMSSETLATTNGPQNVSTAPTVDVENTRTTTFAGAQTQAGSSFNIPTHRLTRADLSAYNGEIATTQAIEPEGLFKTFTRNQQGVMVTPINTAQPDVTEASGRSFKCGRGMLYFDDVKYKIQKDNMNTKLVNPKTIAVDANNDGEDEVYNMYLGIQHEIHFGIQNGIPMLYSVPSYSGVYMSDVDCNREHLTPEQAANDNRLENQPIYPYDLMTKRVIATNYQHGFINTLTDKEDMRELPNINSIDNKPPFTIWTDDGPMLVLTMEAIGEGTGVFEIYMANAQTGELNKYTFDSNKKGPVYAADKTVSDQSEKFGNSEDDVNKLTVSEVYAVIRNGELWYQINVVQQETGIYGYTTFYNAEDQELLKAHTDEQIRAFYEGSNAPNQKPDNTIQVPNNQSTQTGGRNVENPAMNVVITENGESVYTVPVAQNETVQVNTTSN